MGSICEVCGRPQEVSNDLRTEPREDVCFDRMDGWIGWQDDCQAHAIDWRARCLVAESELAAMRADLEDTETNGDVVEVAVLARVEAENARLRTALGAMLDEQDAHRCRDCKTPRGEAAADAARKVLDE